jgi:hypothetical protein
MNWNLLGGIVVTISVIGSIIFFGLRLVEETRVPDYSRSDTVNAVSDVTMRHTYSNGTHMYHGVIPAATPCHTLAKNVSIAESYPEQIRIEFETKPGSDYCAQVISNIPFTVTAEASELATVSASLNGYSVVLELEEVEDQDFIERMNETQEPQDATSTTTEWESLDGATSSSATST